MANRDVHMSTLTHTHSEQYMSPQSGTWKREYMKIWCIALKIQGSDTTTVPTVQVSLSQAPQDRSHYPRHPRTSSWTQTQHILQSLTVRFDLSRAWMVSAEKRKGYIIPSPMILCFEGQRKNAVLSLVGKHSGVFSLFSLNPEPLILLHCNP